MRLDKFLKTSRIIKRRTVANEACSSGRILVNDRVAKPGTQLKIGDIIEINFYNKVVKVRVLLFLNTTRKSDAESMYEVISVKQKQDH